ncbi:MAG: hypothetical protein IID44_27605 [Planctomycetes bacterium]|nr:hypothetical protein [Planctomycetota bacterium]
MKFHSVFLSLALALAWGLVLSRTADAQRPVRIFADEAIELILKDAAADDPFDDPFGKKPSSGPKKKPTKSESGGDTSASVAAPKTPVDPELVQLHLRDGMIVSGKFSVKEISVLTSYGLLKVPITKLRNFTPGLNNTPALGGRITDLVEKLGSNEFAAREESQKQLLAMGLPIRAVLAQHQSGSNVERDRRVKAILEKLAEMADEGDSVEGDGGPQDELIERDKVATTVFTMIGDISPKTFQFYSKYGQLSINLGDIRIAKRAAGGPARDDVRKSLTLEGTYIAQLRFKNSGIKVVKGDKITVSATGTISRNGSSSYRSGPEGNSSRFGYYLRSPKIYGGTLVARIGKGKVVKIGSGRTIVAKSDGTLQFAIGMRPEYATGNYQFTGQYNLTIKVTRGE